MYPYAWVVTGVGIIDDSYGGENQHYWNIVLEKLTPGNHSLYFDYRENAHPEEPAEMVCKITVEMEIYFENENERL